MKKTIRTVVVLLWAILWGVAFWRVAHAQSSEDIHALIEKLEVGEAVYYENLTILPLYYIQPQAVGGYPTLDEALKNKWLEITELQGGHVPEVKITNHSGQYIYLMGGEVLTGCKQDRIVGRDVLIGPNAKNVLVPVYCVEQGRWTHNSPRFSSKDNLGTFELRRDAQKAEGVSQGSIWTSVSRLNSKMGVQSETSAYQALYDSPQVKEKISTYERKMQSIPHMHKDTIGVVVGIGGKIVSADIFSSPAMFKKLWPKLLKSSALAAMNCDNGSSVGPEEAAEFLRTLHQREFAKKSAVDAGVEFCAVDDDINANALLFGHKVIHVAAFAQDEGNYPDDDYSTRGRRTRVMQQRYID